MPSFRATALLLALPMALSTFASLGAGAQVTAHRAATAPVIDGRDDDAAWTAIAPSSDFTVFRPTEGARPTFRTDLKVTFDDRALYVLVRAHDPRPDSIIGLLSRRDNFGPPNDLIQLYIDSYDDGRTGFEYVVNPAGVKADFLLFDDDRFDLSWDGIWDVATRVDSAGWVAEFAFPFSQLRFRGGAQTTFGLMAWRTVGRLGERASWPAYRPSRSGIVSQFGDLDRLRLPSTVRLEASPYLLSRNRNIPPTATLAPAQETSVAIGGDVKFGPTPNVTLDATLNPDFGQIESDPAVLNLSSIETFLPERRPFFLEGVGLFKFTLSRDPNSPEGLFYTRRIGRRPQLYDGFSERDTPQETTILGAGKLTARLGRRTSLASLAAVTDAERGAPTAAGGRYLIEPRTGYGVTRVQRDFRAGRSGVGLMFTGVTRSLDSATATMLHDQAVTGGIATQHQSRDGQYWARAWAVASQVRGSAAAIARTQLSPLHAYQRPDDGLTFDSTRTSLNGTGGQLWLGKTGGVVRYGSSYRYLSPGFDPTDVGYIREADHHSWVVDASLQSTKASAWYRNASAGVLRIVWWSGSGKIDDMLIFNGNAELPSQWTVFLNAQQNYSFKSVCAQACTRGGPAVRKDPVQTVNLNVGGDARGRFVPNFNVGFQRGDGGRTDYARIAPGVLWRAASNLQVSSDLLLESLTNDAQYYARYGSPTSDTSHYVIARLEQVTRAVTTRVQYAATPTLSVEWYAQPFISKGTYSDFRELNVPRADDYARRYRSFTRPGSPGPAGVDFRQFRSNLVTRWEYRPGSVVFLVWSQGRDLFQPTPGTFEFGRDARDLFTLTPKNTFAIKASYWWSR
jgi:hypothetical protein